MSKTFSLANESFTLSTELKDSIRSIENQAPNHIHVLRNKMIDTSMLSDYDLIVISMDSWKKIIDSQENWLEKSPSLLIIKP